MYGKQNPAGGLYIRHADNILIENYRIHQRKTDHRPAIFLDDATNIHIEKLQSTGSVSKAIIETNKCNKITLEGHLVK